MAACTICRSESPAKRGASASASPEREGAAHRESVEVAQQPDPLGDRELRVGDRQQLLEQIAAVDRPVVADLAVVGEHPGRAAAPGRRRRHRAGGVRQERAGLRAVPRSARRPGSATSAAASAGRSDREEPLLRERQLRAAAAAVERARRRAARPPGRESSRTRPRRPGGSPPRSPSRKSFEVAVP